MQQKYEELFEKFSESVELFIRAVNETKSALIATEEWNVKDELCHITFWHENYASNYKALAENQIPVLPEGMSTINSRGVALLRNSTIKDLISRLRVANESLRDSIVVKQVPRMTYSKGGRTYETDEFLTMITRHIVTHTKQVRRAKPALN